MTHIINLNYLETDLNMEWKKWIKRVQELICTCCLITAPPKIFGLFMSANSDKSNFDTTVPFLIQNRLPLPEKLFVQAGTVLILTCISEASRPASQLEFSVNDKIIPPLSKNLQRCQSGENSSLCVGELYTHYGNGFHLQTRTIRKYSIENEASVSDL